MGSDREISNLKWGCVIIFAKFVTSMMGSGSNKAFGVLFPVMIQRFNVSYAMLGFICDLPFAMMLFSGPFVSLVLQRVDHRPAAMAGAIIMGTCLVFCGFIYDATTLGILLTISGISRGFSFLPLVIAVNNYFKDNFVLANTLAAYGATVGVIWFPVLAERSFEAYGFSGAFMIIGAVMLHSVVCGSTIRDPIPSAKGHTMDIEDSSHKRPEHDQNANVKENDEDVENQNYLPGSSRRVECGEHGDGPSMINKSSGESDPLMQNQGDGEDQTDLAGPCQTNSDQDDGSRTSFLSRCKRFISNERIFLMCLPAAFLRVYVYINWVLFLVPHTEQLGIASSRAVFVSSIGGIGGIVGRTLVVILLSRKVNMFPVYTVCGVVTSLTFILDFIGHSFTIRAMMAFVQGTCLFVLDTTEPYLLKVTLADENNFAVGYGLTMFMHGVGSLCAGFLSGAIVDVMQSYTIVFMITGIVSTIFTINLVIISVFLNRRHKSSMSS